MTKKIISLLMILLTVAAFCSCKKADSDETEQTTEEHSHTVSEQASETVTAAERITGKLYAVRNEETLTTDFYCNGGEITPERIAAGLSGWTGLKFGLTSETDETAKAIKINFKPESSIATGNFEGNDRFTFTSEDEMKQFVIDSITESLKANLGDYEVIITVDGKEI